MKWNIQRRQIFKRSPFLKVHETRNAYNTSAPKKLTPRHFLWYIIQSVLSHERITTCIALVWRGRCCTAHWCPLQIHIKCYCWTAAAVASHRAAVRHHGDAERKTEAMTKNYTLKWETRKRQQTWSMMMVLCWIHLQEIFIVFYVDSAN